MGHNSKPQNWNWAHLHIPTAVVYGILISFGGYMINLHTRLAVLESNSTKLEQSISDMSVKIDKIYDKVAFGGIK